MLKEPVFKIAKESRLYDLQKKYADTVYTEKEMFKSLEKLYPNTDGAFGYWSSDKMGIKLGTEAETLYEKELNLTSKNGIRLMKKRSKMFLDIKQKFGEQMDLCRKIRSNFNFELYTRFGVNNFGGMRMLGDDMYISLPQKPTNDYKDELIPVNYPDFLELYAKDIREKEDKN